MSLATTTALMSSVPGFSRGNVATFILYLKEGEKDCSGFHPHNLPIKLDLGQNLHCCVAFSLPSPSEVPPAVPCSSALSLLLTQNKETISRVTQEGCRGSAVLRVASQSRSTRCSLPPLSWSAMTLLYLSKAHDASCSH